MAAVVGQIGQEGVEEGRCWVVMDILGSLLSQPPVTERCRGIVNRVIIVWTGSALSCTRALTASQSL